MSSDVTHLDPRTPESGPEASEYPAGGRTRPALTPGLPAGEFRRWHWWKDELVAFARTLALPATGTKSMLIDRIAAELDAAPPHPGDPDPPPPSSGRTAGDEPDAAPQDPVDQYPRTIAAGHGDAGDPDAAYLTYCSDYFEHHPQATLREGWRSFKWARASGRIPSPMSS